MTGTYFNIDASTLGFNDFGGGNTIDLTGSNTSSDLFMGSGGAVATSGGGSMSFIHPLATGTNGLETQTLAAGGDVIRLNPTGSGAASVWGSLMNGFQDVEGFVLGRDTAMIATGAAKGLPGLTHITAGFGVSVANDSTRLSGNIGAPSEHGMIFNGLSASNVLAHESMVTSGGNSFICVH